MTSVSVTKIRRGYSSPDRHKPLRVEERLIFRKKCFQSFEGVIRKVVSWFNVSNFSSKNISATKYFYPMVNVFFKKNGLFLASFSLFLSFQYSFFSVDSKSNLPMTGCEPRIYGVGSNCSTNWATTAALHAKALFWTKSRFLNNLRIWKQVYILWCPKLQKIHKQFHF